jgi:CubicO group peptidase (beta-lactamase class C family)
MLFDKEQKENPDKVFTNEDFLPGVIANKQPLVYQPGEKGNYDNINYLILALIVEKSREYLMKNTLKEIFLDRQR